MALPKKTLYQLLGVGADASPEVVRIAYDAQVARLAHAATPEAGSERAILAGAIEVLADPVRRKQYDEWLSEERRRALSSGSTQEERARPANARLPDAESRPWSGRALALGISGMVVVVLAGGVGTWMYFDHARKMAAHRLEAEKLALEAQRREQEAAARSAQQDMYRARAEADREAAEARMRQAEIERSRQQYSFDQQRQSQQAANEERMRQQALQRAEQQRRAEEQESLRRSQQQLQREKRYLQELESNRTMKF